MARAATARRIPHDRRALPVLPPANREWLYPAAGAFLLFWAGINTYLDLSRYGWQQGLYWWFCNLNTIGTAYGLFARSQPHLLGFFAFSIFTQTFWIVDNLWRMAFGVNLIGVVEFLYQPGYPMDEFVLTHYHYFTFPISILALYFLPREVDRMVRRIPQYNIVIYAVSYFAFPEDQNINCVHEPCFALFGLSGRTYSFFFFFFVLGLHMGIAYGLKKLYLRLPYSARGKKAVLWCFGLGMAASVALTGWDVAYKNTLPSFRCQEPPATDPVKVRCDYTVDYEKNVMLLAYTATNDGTAKARCDIYFTDGRVEELFDEGILLDVGQKLSLKTPIAYPKENMVASLLARCH